MIDHLARAAGDGPDTEPRTLDNTRADVLRDLVLGGALGGSGTHDGPAAAPEDAVRPGTDQHAADRQDHDRPEESDQPAAAAGHIGPAAGPTAGECHCDHGSPVRTEVRVTVPWRVLAGLSDRPADLEGHGPLPAQQARAMAFGLDAVWLRLLTDPVTGTAEHLDRRRYRPPRRLAAFVRARDRTCAAPGCRVPAARCDLDHVVPYDHAVEGGGPGRTGSRNLKPACRRHHRIKTHGGWRCEPVPDPAGGRAPAVQWTAPSGRTWLVRAPEVDEPERDAGGRRGLADAA